MKNLILLVTVFGVCSATTNNDDSVDSDRIKIDDIDHVWKKVHSASSRVYTTPSATATNINNPLETVRSNGEFPSQTSLKEFLESFAEKVRKDKVTNVINQEDVVDVENVPKDKKSWNRLDIQRHKYTPDDRKGWVTLDPIPWSVSKVAKWKPKTTEAPWNSYKNKDENPWENDFHENSPSGSQYHYHKRPEPVQDDYKVFYTNDRNPVVNHQPLSRPFTVYDQSVKNSHHKIPVQFSGFNRPQDSFQYHRDGIIIDNSPPNFPTENYDFNRRSGHEENPQNNPLLGDGEWVLLSTTKGYKSPRTGQRSLDFSPQSLSTRKSVHLTVLPPLKNSKINMTTSHGGLLQVESTFDSVEQAQRKYVKQQKKKNKKRKRPNGQIKTKKKVAKELVDTTIATIPRSTDRSAVLAAVGAGMIPATMAMLVPMVNGGRRRRKREILTTSGPSSNIEITLPRYY